MPKANSDLKLDMQGVKMPGYKQLLDISIVALRLDFTKGNCNAQWEITPQTDDSNQEPHTIESGTIAIVNIPEYVLESHARFFEESVPALMENYLRSRSLPTEPPTPDEATIA